jgi:hypothetical protein
VALDKLAHMRMLMSVMDAYNPAATWKRSDSTAGATYGDCVDKLDAYVAGTLAGGVCMHACMCDVLCRFWMSSPAQAVFPAADLACALCYHM